MIFGKVEKSEYYTNSTVPAERREYKIQCVEYAEYYNLSTFGETGGYYAAFDTKSAADRFACNVAVVGGYVKESKQLVFCVIQCYNTSRFACLQRQIYAVFAIKTLLRKQNLRDGAK